jgi:hypothetical protein
MSKVTVVAMALANTWSIMRGTERVGFVTKTPDGKFQVSRIVDQSVTSAPEKPTVITTFYPYGTELRGLNAAKHRHGKFVDVVRFVKGEFVVRDAMDHRTTFGKLPLGTNFTNRHTKTGRPARRGATVYQKTDNTHARRIVTPAKGATKAELSRFEDDFGPDHPVTYTGAQ